MHASKQQVRFQRHAQSRVLLLLGLVAVAITAMTGERFDLRSPYADDGWVDPDETDAFAGFKKIGEKLLNFTGKTKKQVGPG